MQYLFAPGPIGPGGFNPRPALRPGDACTGPRWRTPTTKFQSAPGLEAGRCPDITSIAPRRVSFNPRPALRPGDAAERVIRARGA